MDSEALNRFERLIRASTEGEPVRLAELALCVGEATATDDVDVDRRLAQLDSMGELLLTRDVDGVRELLFGELGFTGNSVDYYSADNSRLDLVLDTRRGIPITLAIIMADVAQTAGCQLMLTNSPGHVLVVDPHNEVWYDAFSGGVELDRTGVEELLAPFIGGRRVTPAMTRPASHLQVVSRMLNNLRAIHSSSGDKAALLLVEQLTCRLPGADIRHHYVVSNLLADRGDLAGAAASLERAAALHPGQASELNKRATILRARLN